HVANRQAPLVFHGDLRKSPQGCCVRLAADRQASRVVADQQPSRKLISRISAARPSTRDRNCGQKPGGRPRADGCTARTSGTPEDLGPKDPALPNLEMLAPPLLLN